MMSILLSLYAATDRYLRLQIDRPEAKAKALDDHRAIFEAFKTRRSATASKLIKAHIAGAYHDVMARLQGSDSRSSKAATRRRGRGVAT